MRHKPKPPLCKAPEAAAQRRCGDHVSGGRVVITAQNLTKYAKKLKYKKYTAEIRRRMEF